MNKFLVRSFLRYDQYMICHDFEINDIPFLMIFWYKLCDFQPYFYVNNFQRWFGMLKDVREGMIYQQMKEAEGKGVEIVEDKTAEEEVYTISDDSSISMLLHF